MATVNVKQCGTKTTDNTDLVCPISNKIVDFVQHEHEYASYTFMFTFLVFLMEDSSEKIYHMSFEKRKSKTVLSHRFDFGVLALLSFNNDCNVNAAVTADQLQNVLKFKTSSSQKAVMKSFAKQIR